MPFQPVFEEDVSLTNYTTYKIGGPAKKFIVISSIKEMTKLIHYLHQTGQRYMILGKGSNVLFDDLGFDGVVILNKICHIEIHETTIKVGAGYSYPLLSSKASRKGLSGLEFASGIPGSVGGAIFMNAGASGLETKDALLSVECIDEDGSHKTFTSEECLFSYRSSRFQKEKKIIVAATFQLKKDPFAIKRHRESILYRLKTQPYKEKSCGCVFRNPKELSAGALIEELGLKGHRKGGASISAKHANFILNANQATAKEIKEMIELIRKKAYQKRGIELVSELQMIPYKESV